MTVVTTLEQGLVHVSDLIEQKVNMWLLCENNEPGLTSCKMKPLDKKKNKKTITHTLFRQRGGNETAAGSYRINSRRVETTQDPPCFSKPITIQGESFQRG